MEPAWVVWAVGTAPSRRGASRLLQLLGLGAPVLLFPLPECCSLSHSEVDLTAAVFAPACLTVTEQPLYYKAGPGGRRLSVTRRADYTQSAKMCWVT